MLPSRREILLGIVVGATPVAAPAQTVGGAAAWIGAFKLLADIGESLDAFADAIGNITIKTVKGYDWFKDRGARAALILLSGRLTALVADQQNVRIALDRFGRTWRHAHRHGHRPDAAQRATLRTQWRDAVEIVRTMALRTEGMLRDVRSHGGDIDLEDAYQDLQNALAAKRGVLALIQTMPQPGKGEDLADLVDYEETFLGLRAATERAQRELDSAIKRMGR